ncbi:putative calcium P-type ATPase [Fusarium austroafricanum]|uniref:Calcium-transporting ATPase n=1 Tax=Fusarium austroafricanum TaxID=2364996 RepID=A0A8H4P857_9HYPO|nr:putative calcium P-type ATPase [Fusarium austroafricanum]
MIVTGYGVFPYQVIAGIEAGPPKTPQNEDCPAKRSEHHSQTAPKFRSFPGGEASPRNDEFLFKVLYFPAGPELALTHLGATLMDDITTVADSRYGGSGEGSNSNSNGAGSTHQPQIDNVMTSQQPDVDGPPFHLDHDEHVQGNNFAFTPTQLHQLLTAKNIAALRAFGGLLGLAAGLRTDISAGLSADETTLEGTVTLEEAVASGNLERPPVLSAASPPPSPPLLHNHLFEHRDNHFVDRKRVFGNNRLPQIAQKSFFRLLWIAFNDKLIILLTISATISLAIGIYQSVDKSIGASRVEWVDGVTIVVAILVIIIASAATDWQKNYKFKKVNERKQQRDVTVVRSGKLQRISVHDVLVGDLVHLEAGDVVAVDGVLVQASSLQMNESSISGEADLVHKTVPRPNHSATSKVDPFILSGTTVARGIGYYLVTAVGVNSTYGRILMSLRDDVKETPLQAKLGRLGKQLIVIGSIAGSIFFLVLFIRYMVNLHTVTGGPSQKAENFLHILILAVTVVVITIPEGLALNVTVALAFATRRMLRDNNLVRLIRSCEIMGNATTVCSDKTGTLTQNKMSVVCGRVGLESYFDDTDPVAPDPDSSMSRASTIKCDSSIDLAKSLSPECKRLMKDSIALNSTAFETDDSGSTTFVGSSTETALLQFGRQHLGMGNLAEERANCPLVAILPFDSSRKWMGVLVKINDDRYRLLVKGAAEVVFEYCAYVVLDPTFRVPIARLSENDRASYRNTIDDYANRMLRPVAIAYRDFSAQEIFEGPDDDPDNINLEWLASGMIFIGAFGICDPLRPEVVESVRQCQAAGVFVRMVTGDNFMTAKAIAKECGIYTAGGIAMDGPTFRDLTPEQLDAVIPRLQVLARSSPEDKLLLVTHLKRMNETVAVTGDGTNDGLALKAADVGFAMGIQGTEVAKEAASIILLDDNFASIVKALAWGRTVNDSVKKFCQFQFTINITAGLITVVSELVGDAVFTVVQLLWLNLIMDIFASLGYATDHPSPDFLKRKPEPRNASIITITMWKMIICQAIYQLIVVFVVHYAGWDLFNPDTEFEVEKLQTLVLNIYVWMQFFNQHNCRRVDNKLDIWYQGILRNPWFIGVQLITIAGQFIIVFKGGEAFDTTPITGAQWGWSLLFGVMSIPLGALIRQIPDSLVQRLFTFISNSWFAIWRPTRAFISRAFGCFKRKKNDDKEAQQPEQEMGPVENILHMMHLTPDPEEDETPMTQEQREAMERSDQARLAKEGEKKKREIDLNGLLEAAKLGREHNDAIFEIHPKTQKDDPILRTSSGKNSTLPPSQDEQFMKFVALNTRRHRRPKRTNPRDPARPGQQRQEQRSSWRHHLSWEGMLRSKRR